MHSHADHLSFQATGFYAIITLLFFHAVCAFSNIIVVLNKTNLYLHS